jgi:hypothetical protein
MAVDGGAALAAGADAVEADADEADADGAADDKDVPTTLELALAQPAASVVKAAASAPAVNRERVSEVMGPQP